MGWGRRSRFSRLLPGSMFSYGETAQDAVSEAADAKFWHGISNGCNGMELLGSTAKTSASFLAPKESHTKTAAGQPDRAAKSCGKAV